MAFKKDSRKRRSDRLMFMIPVRAEGQTEAGEDFVCSGHAVAINRYGAYIRLERPVPVAHKIRLTNLGNNLRGEFRIVKNTESPAGEETGFGVEAVGDYPSFWGIHFPVQARKPGESRGLLECQQCRLASLHPLTLDEIETLESGDTVKKSCASCRSKTAWKFAMEEAHPGWQIPKTEPIISGGAARPSRGGTDLPTVFMQRPVSIRIATGEAEIVQTENLSKDEIRCTSKNKYEVNQVVTLEWENSGTGQRLQVQGRIRRRQTITGSPRVIYSIRYEGSPVILPPLPLKPAGELYIVMGVLIATVSVLMAVNTQALASNPAPSSSASAYRVAYLSAILLLLSVAYKCWKTILAREPESRRPFRKRHLITRSLAAAVFLGSLAVGVIAGMATRYEREKAQLFLHHLVVARIFEMNIDAAENRVMATPPDYADACATLQLLASQWQSQLHALTVAADELSRHRLWQNARFRKGMNSLEEILTLDQRKLRLVQEQIALSSRAQGTGPEKQLDFWQSSFTPLRQKILKLNEQKSRVARTLIAEQ